MRMHTPMLGWGLASIWLGWVAMALPGLRHDRDSGEAAKLRAAIDRIAPRLAALAPGVPLAIRMPHACTCAFADAGNRDWQAIARAVGTAHGHLIDLPAGLASPSGAELLLLSAEGRVVYAGPPVSDAACGHPLSIAPAIPALLSTRSGDPVIAPSSSCPAC